MALAGAVVDLRGQTLQLTRLARLFQHNERPLQRMYVVVVGLAQERLGIAVDELLGQQDIVTNPMLNAWQDAEGGEVTDECQNFFDVVYGSVPPNASTNDSSLTVGVQKNNTAGNFTLVGCDTTGGTVPPVSTGQRYRYTFGCLPATPTPTLTPLISNTPTNTPTRTVTNTPTITPTFTNTYTPSSTPTATATCPPRSNLRSRLLHRPAPRVAR